MLCLSQTTGYAIVALSCLSDPQTHHWVLVKDVCACTDIPQAYLSKILHSLARWGLIHAKRGYRGGFILARPADEISLMDIAQAVEGETWSLKCLLGIADCSDQRACPTHTFWKQECAKIETKLRETKLKEVADTEHQCVLRSDGRCVAKQENDDSRPGRSGRRPRGAKTIPS